MPGFSDYLELELLDHVLRGNTGGTSFPQPTATYVSLHTADPTDAGTGAEVSGGAYARQNAYTKWAAPASGAIATNAAITFPEATADWGMVTHFAIWDALSGGNMLFSGALAVAKEILTGDIADFAAGVIDITLD